LEGKKYFKCHDYGHFQSNCSNRKALTIREEEEIRDLEEEISDEEFEVEEHTLIISDVGELLVIRRTLHINEVPLEPSQIEQISILSAQLKTGCVSLMEEIVPIWPQLSTNSLKSPMTQAKEVGNPF